MTLLQQRQTDEEIVREMRSRDEKEAEELEKEGRRKKKKKLRYQFPL
jgi:hypothetical protein